jgi:phage terminase small subunit
MTTENATVERQIRPNDLMTELGIKKDAYYEYLKHLGIKAERDSTNKVYLSEMQVNLIRALKEHVNKTGKMDGFGALAQQTEASLDAAAETVATQNAAASGVNMDELLLGAAELAGHRMTLQHQLMLQMADKMTYDDLPDSVRSKVDAMRQAADPKQQNLSSVADQMLNQWRQKRQQPVAV